METRGCRPMWMERSELWLEVKESYSLVSSLVLQKWIIDLKNPSFSPCPSYIAICLRGLAFNFSLLFTTVMSSVVSIRTFIVLTWMTWPVCLSKKKSYKKVHVHLFESWMSCIKRLHCEWFVICCRILSNHKLSGPISADIGKLESLQLLYASITFFFAHILIPPAKAHWWWQNVFVCRALHDNNFYGEIPPELGNCTQLHSM